MNSAFAPTLRLACCARLEVCTGAEWQLQLRACGVDCADSPRVTCMLCFCAAAGMTSRPSRGQTQRSAVPRWRSERRSVQRQRRSACGRKQPPAGERSAPPRSMHCMTSTCRCVRKCDSCNNSSTVQYGCTAGQLGRKVLKPASPVLYFASSILYCSGLLLIMIEPSRSAYGTPSTHDQVTLPAGTSDSSTPVPCCCCRPS